MNYPSTSHLIYFGRRKEWSILKEIPHVLLFPVSNQEILMTVFSGQDPIWFLVERLLCPIIMA
jgi:hypothetical protein